MTMIDQLNAEQVLALAPDIVLVAIWNDPDTVHQLRDLGVPMYTFAAFDTVRDALDNIARIGEITGDEQRAQALIDEFYRRYGEVAIRIAGKERPRVLSWDDWGATVGPGMSIHDIIELAGGRNAAAEYGVTGWHTLDAEAVIQMNPDVIITPSGDAFAEHLKNDPVFASVTAVRNGDVYYVEHLEALNHYFIEAIESLASRFAPGGVHRLTVRAPESRADIDVRPAGSYDGKVQASQRRTGARYVKPVVVLVLLVAGLAAAIVVATAMGVVQLPYGETARIVFSKLLGLPAGASASAEAIIWNVRLPRVAAAGLVGLALGVGGAAMQALFKNPLASPDLIGVSTGGALGAVAAIFLGWSVASPWLMPLAAFVGALAVGVVVYGLATRSGRTDVATLLLAGVACSSLGGAVDLAAVPLC